MADNIAAAQGAETQGGGRKYGEGRTIHYYTAPDGTRVEDVLNIQPPGKLSKGAMWRMANPDKYKDAYVNWEAVLN
jgi:hypothetical protein